MFWVPRGARHIRTRVAGAQARAHLRHCPQEVSQGRGILRNQSRVSNDLAIYRRAPMGMGPWVKALSVARREATLCRRSAPKPLYEGRVLRGDRRFYFSGHAVDGFSHRVQAFFEGKSWRLNHLLSRGSPAQLTRSVCRTWLGFTKLSTMRCR